MKILTLLGTAFALYAGVGAVLWVAQERLVFHPRAVSADKRRQFQHLEIQFAMNDGAVLRGWLLPSSARPSDSAPQNNPCKLVIYFGGNAEEVSDNLAHPIPANAAQLFVNYRGFGDSDGKPSARAFEQDALQLFDQAAQKLDIPPDQICVFGRSLGTHMAAVVAAKRPVARAVMISPFDSVLKIAQTRYPVYPVRVLLRHRFETAPLAEQAKAPALFILAEHDWVVPRKRSDALIKSWNGPHQVIVIPNSTHNHFHGAEYQQAVAEFLNGGSGENGGSGGENGGSGGSGGL